MLKVRENALLLSFVEFPFEEIVANTISKILIALYHD